MYLHADSVTIDCNEMGLELHIRGDEGPLAPLVINIQHIDLDRFYESARNTIGGYLHERDEARRTFSVINSNPSEWCDISDSKHPNFHSIHADIWDARAGK